MVTGQAGRQIRTSHVVASIIALFALAVAQPLLDLLGRNAEFFLARAAPPPDLVLLAVLLGFGIPLLIAAMTAGVYAIDARAGRIVHAVVLMVLGTVLALQVSARTIVADLPGLLEIGIAAGLGALLTVAYFRYEVTRSIFNFAAVAPFAVVGLFLFTSSTSQLIFTAPTITEAANLRVDNPAPVVMVVFDEFPVASLMDGSGNLQEDVYPSFARLARDGTWFSNAITVQQQTEKAMPAILTGVDPGDRKAIPTADFYPANLFTLLAGTYELTVREAVTGLCPEFACRNASRPVLPAVDRWQTLADDLSVVAGHVFLPDDMTEDLPPINQTWGNFGDAEEIADFDMVARFREVEGSDRRIPIAGFLNDLAPPDGRPRLDFLHALVPHVPWTYLQSGQEYPAPVPAPGSASPGWGSDEWLVNQAYQQHLIQVLYADKVIGDVIDRLEATGQYDDALIVVLADHGISVRPDIPHRRVAYDDTIGDIAAVPLFIKRPNDPGAGKDTYRAETVDVLPTIADVLGVEVPWDTDGVSLFSPDRPQRTQSQITGDEGVKVFGVDGSEARAIAARKVDDFGDDGPYGLAPSGHADLLGASIDRSNVSSASGLRATIQDRDAFRSVDLDGPALPARVSGGIVNTDQLDGDVVVAAGVNGTVVAVTRTEHTDDGRVIFRALLPPDALVEGDNTIDLFLVDGTGSERALRTISW